MSDSFKSYETLLREEDEAEYAHYLYIWSEIKQLYNFEPCPEWPMRELKYSFSGLTLEQVNQTYIDRLVYRELGIH